MAIKLLSAVHGERGAIRNYQHPEFGVLPIVTVWGAPGCADVINVTVLHECIRVRNAKREGRDPYAPPVWLQEELKRKGCARVRRAPRIKRRPAA
jgi:hypothetical protein